MSSSLAVRPRVGAQRPTHLLTPDGRFDFTDGDIAIDLAASLGLELLEWQRWLVRWILAVDAEGRPACNTVVIVVPRQNGKGAVLEALELFWLIVGGVPIVIHTAHEADTAAGHMERIEALTADPDVDDLPNIHTYKSNGKERTRNLDDKLVLQYRTRTKATKRGASPQRIVVDESQELQDAHLAALVPAMAAQSMDVERMPQLIYTGSAPLEHSFYMHDLLDRIEEQRPERTLLAMWACDSEADPFDVENWYLSNPSLGILISEDWVRQTEMLTMAPPDFAAERLGVPKRPAIRLGNGPIPLERWDDLVDARSMPDARRSRIAVDTNPERSWFTVCLAGERADGLVHVEITKSFPTKQPAVEYVNAAAAKLGVRPICSDASGLADDLANPDVMKPGEQAAATSKLIDATRGEAPRVRHQGEPALRKAVEIAQTKPYGDGGVTWTRRGSDGDISPLTALTMAFGRLGAESEPEFFAY